MNFDKKWILNICWLFQALSLPTGERLFVKDEYFRLLFETSDLSSASPVAMAHCVSLWCFCVHMVKAFVMPSYFCCFCFFFLLCELDNVNIIEKTKPHNQLSFVSLYKRLANCNNIWPFDHFLLRTNLHQNFWKGLI